MDKHLTSAAFASSSQLYDPLSYSRGITVSAVRKCQSNKCNLTLPAGTGLAAAVSLQHTRTVQCGSTLGPPAALPQGKLCY
ncbi:hypothetical protein E2C01_025637 [Portunus trituberculatus]|uniref:Uncharacterized protein n=1 Tax=Portunus trituberculatus TaxID=210409 RepID=A0A5B7EG91_PORTR|nr:hypothetical protein [Portunus trituberculatus]